MSQKHASSSKIVDQVPILLESCSPPEPLTKEGRRLQKRILRWNLILANLDEQEEKKGKWVVIFGKDSFQLFDKEIEANEKADSLNQPTMVAQVGEEESE